MIRITKHSDLSAQLQSQIQTQIHTEFGHIAIVSQTEWATPDWTVMDVVNDDIVCFYSIVERGVTVDDQTLHVGGINNLITSPAHRGRGHASKLLRQTEWFMFEQLKCDLGLLLCADAVIPFYEQLGWFLVGCPVLFTQSGGEEVWSANTMLLSNNGPFEPRSIHLNGRPW